jgi:hypothetical protein
MASDAILRSAIQHGVTITRVNGERRYSYLGRQVPPGWREVAREHVRAWPALWLFQLEPDAQLAALESES